MKLFSIVTSTSLLLLCSVSTAALADGMPFAQQQNLKPIDKAMTNQAPATAAPIAMTPEAAPAPAAPATAPVAVAPPPAQLPPPPPVPEERTVEVQPDTSFFGLSVGVYDPITHDKKSTAFNAEWQPGVKIVGTLQPIFGAMGTTEGSMLGYAGLGVPYNITDHVFIMPSVAVGAYKANGDDFDLDRTIVGRLATEIAYQFDDKSRLGLNFALLTNGRSLDAGDRTEMISLTYTMPFSGFWGGSSGMHEEPLIISSASPLMYGQKPLPNDLP